MSWRKKIRLAGKCLAGLCAASLWGYGLYTVYLDGADMIAPLLSTGAVIGFFMALWGEDLL